MHDMPPLLRVTSFPPLRRLGLATLQVNLGYRCNQSCLHCDVNAGPGRAEQMVGETVGLIPRVRAARRLPILDLTPYLDQVMCRDLISVDRQGRLCDCDLNQQLGLSLGTPASRRLGTPMSPRRYLRDLLAEDFSGTPIAVADHCYGCAAGPGSSYGEALNQSTMEHAA